MGLGAAPPVTGPVAPTEQFTPNAPEPQATVHTSTDWGTCPESERLLLQDGRGDVYRSCLSSGVVVPTIPLALSELGNLLWPDGWTLLGAQ
jgi:hypothetical protein